jgi:hypothetical protein
MDKHTLASKLRECQRQLGQAPAFFIHNLPDDLIIDAYVTCHDCQARLVDEDTLEKCIFEAKDHEEFLALVSRYTRSHLHSQEPNAGPILDGFICAVTNSAFPNMVLLEQAFLIDEFMEKVQGWSPYRDYVLEHGRYVSNRMKAKADVQEAFDDARIADGDWFAINVAQAVQMIDYIADKYPGQGSGVLR